MRIWIAEGVYIDDTAYRFSTAHSGGPGGQHVNTSNTKVILDYPLDAIEGLQPEQRQRLYQKLGKRINAAASIHVISQKGRSQWRNRQDAALKLEELLREALKMPRKRHATRVSYAQKQARLKVKKKRADIKKIRHKKIHDDD